MTVETRSMKKKKSMKKSKNNKPEKKQIKIKGQIKDKKNSNKLTLINKNKEPDNLEQNKKKNPLVITLSESDLFERNFIINNEAYIQEKYPKVHPINNIRIYDKGIYWQNFNDYKGDKKYIYNYNGYFRKFNKEFDKIDKEFVDMYDKQSKIKILAYYTELDILCVCAENYNKEIKNHWFLAPEGYYWKWHHEKCYFNFDWVTLEQINTNT
jgi:hypothetical protein